MKSRSFETGFFLFANGHECPCTLPLLAPGLRIVLHRATISFFPTAIQSQFLSNDAPEAFVQALIRDIGEWLWRLPQVWICPWTSCSQAFSIRDTARNRTAALSCTPRASVAQFSCVQPSIPVAPSSTRAPVHHPRSAISRHRREASALAFCIEALSARFPRAHRAANRLQ